MGRPAALRHTNPTCAQSVSEGFKGLGNQFVYSKERKDVDVMIGTRECSEAQKIRAEYNPRVSHPEEGYPEGSDGPACLRNLQTRLPLRA
jgi:hypothetical protein